MSAIHFAGSMAAASAFVNQNISLSNATITDTGSGAEAAITIQNDGDAIYQTQNSGNTTVTDEWILDGLKGAGVGDDYDVRCDVNSGILDTGISSTTASWLDLSSSQYSWAVSVNSGTGSANVTVQIRDKATLTVQASADFNLSASV